jgi:sugar (pentulose or hexulose) kinase
MVFEFVGLGGMEVNAKVLAASHDVVAGFVSTQATGARVGVLGVDAVSNSADG